MNVLWNLYEAFKDTAFRPNRRSLQVCICVRYLRVNVHANLLTCEESAATSFQLQPGCRAKELLEAGRALLQGSITTADTAPCIVEEVRHLNLACQTILGVVYTPPQW